MLYERYAAPAPSPDTPPEAAELPSRAANEGCSPTTPSMAPEKRAAPDGATNAGCVAKRSRSDDATALVSCFDQQNNPVEVDLKILEPFNCRLYAVIKYQPPSSYCAQSGRPVWRCNMTRAMLTTFVRSLEHGQLSMGKDVSVAEALSTMEFENIPIGVSSRCVAEQKLLACPPAGAVFQKRAERVQMAVLRTSEQIAHAVCRWPRVEACLDAAITGFPVAPTCTTSRVWVRFSKKPNIAMDRGDLELALARKWPTWMQKTLSMFGVVHDQLAYEKLVVASARDKATYEALESKVEADQLGSFMHAPFDCPHFARTRASRKENAAGDRFALEMRDILLEAAVAKAEAGAARREDDDVHTERVRYARACFSLAEVILMEAASPASMYSGACLDDAGKSIERLQLEKSFKQRGVKVVRWSDDDKSLPSMKPLVFPSNWFDSSPTSSSASSSFALLLDFNTVR